jgi:hypothetical protein
MDSLPPAPGPDDKARIAACRQQLAVLRLWAENNQGRVLPWSENGQPAVILKNLDAVGWPVPEDICSQILKHYDPDTSPVPPGDLPGALAMVATPFRLQRVLSPSIQAAPPPEPASAKRGPGRPSDIRTMQDALEAGIRIGVAFHVEKMRLKSLGSTRKARRPPSKAAVQRLLGFKTAKGFNDLLGRLSVWGIIWPDSFDIPLR